MTILRDIIARMGMSFDPKGFNQADKSITGLKGGLGSIINLAALTGAALGTIKLLELGSDANETLNVLNTSFGQNTEAVKKWAAEFAEDSKRSEFQMREMAGTLGAVLNPLMENNREVAAEMSTTLAGLAVDLGSFYNLADDDVLAKLRSGITGEAEPLKRLGVVMTEATLAEFAHNEGIKKNIKSMSIAEKTALRYQFILSKTKDAQGDAARTSQGWANATKGLQGGLRDLGTNIGLIMLPAAEKAVNWASSLVIGLSKLAKESNIVQAALLVLGSLAASVALKMLIAFGPLILKFLLIGAAILGATLIVEDFISFLQGKKSVLGEFINMLAGPGSAEEAAKYLQEAWAGLKLYASEELFPSISNLSNALGWARDDAMDFAKGIWENIKQYIEPATAILRDFGNWVLKIGRAAAEFFGIDVDKLKADFEAMLPTKADIATGVLLGPGALALKKGLEKFGGGAEYGSSLVGAEDAGARQFRKERKQAEDLLARMSPQQRKQFGKIGAEAQERIYSQFAGQKEAPSKQEINQSIKIELKTQRQIDKVEAQRLAAEVGKVTNQHNKKALKALKQRTE